jgi:hypothetical protein
MRGLIHPSSTLILLANHEVLLEVESHSTHIQSSRQISSNKLKVQESITSSIGLLKELVQLDLVKYLPSSA